MCLHSILWLKPRARPGNRAPATFFPSPWGMIKSYYSHFQCGRAVSRAESRYRVQIHDLKKEKNKKVMYQKPMEGVIGIYLKFKEFYPRPKHSLNISIKKFIGNNMERLKVESKWANLHVFGTFEGILWIKRTKNM